MRRQDAQQAQMFSCISPEERVPADHPLRPIRRTVDEASHALNPRLQNLYAPTGRPGIPPERLLPALSLQVLYTIRSGKVNPCGGLLSVWPECKLGGSDGGVVNRQRQKKPSQPVRGGPAKSVASVTCT